MISPLATWFTDDRAVARFRRRALAAGDTIYLPQIHEDLPLLIRPERPQALDGWRFA